MGTSSSELKKICILPIEDVKIVHKPWGWEKWIADGTPHFPYVLKEMFIKSSYKTSLQFHRKKQETSYIQKGRGILYYSDDKIDADRYAQGGYSQQELEQFIKKMKKRELAAGTVFHVLPGFLHRMEAVEDLLLIEASTVELDDIYRLQDDFGRGHGRISKEHSG